jgi:hypothetical protein
MSSGTSAGVNGAPTPGSQSQPGASMNNGSNMNKGTMNNGSGTTGTGINSGLNNGLNRAPCGSAATGLGNSGMSGSNTGLGQTPRITTDTNPTAGTNQTAPSTNSRGLGSTIGNGC